MKSAALIISLLIILPLVNAQEISYYLHDRPNQSCSGKLMDTSKPTGFYPSYENLDEGAAIWCTTPLKHDTTIEGDVRITLFIEAFFIKPDILPIQMRFIKVSLIDAYSGNIDTIASSRVVPLIYLSNSTVQEHTFTINNVDYSVPSGHSIGIKVEKAIDLLSYFPFSIMAPFFSTNVMYDSRDSISFAEIPLNITGGGIYLQCYSKKANVKPGKQVEYGIMIYNNASVQDEIKLSHNYNGNKWDVKIEPSIVKVEPNLYNFTDVIVKAPGDAKEGDYLNITITAIGRTSSDSIWLNTTVVPFEYGVKVISKDAKKEGKPGEKINFTFEIKNTGDIEDTYNLKVDCPWESEISKEQMTLKSGESEDVNVYITIPLNASNGTKQDVILTASSINSDKESSAKSVLTVIYLEKPAPEENKMRTIGYILFVVGVGALLAIAAFLGKVGKKAVVLSTEERMIEVVPGGKAVFSIKISNPLEKLKGGKNRVRYRIGFEGKLPEKWDAKIDREEIILDGGEEAEIKLEVSVPKDALIDEWASLDVVVSPNVGKSERMNFLITLREPKPVLEMEYEHEGEMEEGKKVLTKIRIENKGESDAENKSIIIMVNGKEKNRVDGINIPAGGYVEIELPWIAEKENEIEIKIV